MDGVVLAFVFSGLLFLLAADAQESFNIETVLDETDFQVEQIANQAVLNQGNVCGSLSSCSLDTCLRRPCLPQSKSEIQTLSCISLDENSDCSNGTGTCRSLSVSYQKPYIRIPPDMVLENDKDFEKILCAQKPLDTKLERAWNSTRKFYQSKALFGGVQGYLYVLPGRDYVSADQCNSYDPRVRPWYIASMAVQKSVYILLDTSISMSNAMGPLSSRSRFDVAKNILSQLLNTLINGDRVAVSKIGGDMLGSPVVVILGEQETSSSEPAVSSLRDSVSNLKVDNEPKDMKKALTSALEFFNSTNLNVIMLFTDGQFASNFNFTALNPLFQQLNQENVVVFVYRLGSFTSNDPAFQQMQKSLNMTYEAVTDGTNPLLRIHSYFDYIAWLRFVAVKKKPVWVRLYKDLGGFGSVITSIFPAFDSNQQLIGVASIDIVADELVKSLGSSVVENAVLKRYFDPSQEKPLPLVQPLPNATSITCGFKGTLNPVCPRRDSTTPMKDFICCGGCATPAPPPPKPVRLGIGAISGVIVGGVAVVAILVSALLYLCKKSMRSPQSAPLSPPPAPLESAKETWEPAPVSPHHTK